MKLRVAINARLLSGGEVGGVESFIVGLVRGLGQLDGPEDYVIIGHPKEPDWLEPYLGPNQRIVCQPGPSSKADGNRRFAESLKRSLGPMRPFVRTMWRRLFPQPERSVWPKVPVSDGFVEGLACNVLHVPYQRFVLAAVPTVYNPHDLQHLHYPQFFAPSSIAWRETMYRAGCHLAHTTVATSQWIKDDIIRQYGVHPDKIQVIPFAPFTQGRAPLSPNVMAEVKRRFGLEQPFAFYPAATWEHKNHIRLLQALAQLRDNTGHRIHLVCTGSLVRAYWPRVEEAVRALSLSGQVRFLGYVSQEELRGIYRLAQFVIVPTLFEAASGPVFEAWQEDVPVACSTVTSLPEQAGNGALLFDPLSVDAIAAAVHRMAGDEHLRAKLRTAGKERLGDFSLERTAKAYRAVYRRAAGRPLTEEDQWLLGWDWMANCKKELERCI